jgi:hypothetical protein
MFNRDKREAGVAELKSQVDRMASLTPAALAAEVMSSVFGASGPGADGSALTVTTVANQFISEGSSWINDDATREQRARALGWSVTRPGEAALSQGTVSQALSAAS